MERIFQRPVGVFLLKTSWRLGFGDNALRRSMPEVLGYNHGSLYSIYAF